MRNLIFDVDFGFDETKPYMDVVLADLDVASVQLFAPNKNGFGSALKPPNGVRWFQMQANRNGVEVCDIKIHRNGFSMVFDRIETDFR